MRKGHILMTNYVNGKPTLFICYQWDGEEYIPFYGIKSQFLTIGGAERFLKKRGFTEIETN